MIIPADYLCKYATPEQLYTLTALERNGWKVSHLFTVPDWPGKPLLWLISEGVVSRNKRSPYSHAWIDRKGKLHRWPAHLSRTSR